MVAMPTVALTLAVIDTHVVADPTQQEEELGGSVDVDAALLGGYALNVVLLLFKLFRRHSLSRWLLLFLPLLVNALLFMDEALALHGPAAEPSARGSASIVIACAGQIASHNLQAMQRSSPLGYLRNACNPRKRADWGVFSSGY